MAGDVGRRGTSGASQPDRRSQGERASWLCSQAPVQTKLSPEMGLERWSRHVETARLPTTRGMVYHLGSIVDPCLDGTTAPRASCVHVISCSRCSSNPGPCGVFCLVQGEGAPPQDARPQPVGQPRVPSHTWNTQKTDGGFNTLHDSPGGLHALWICIKNNLGEAGRGERSLLEVVNPLQVSVNVYNEFELVRVSRRILGLLKLR